jgi:hypothetical protein
MILTAIFLVEICGCQTSGCPSAGGSTAAALPDTPENRASLADKYLELVPFEAALKGTGDELLKQVPPAMQARFKEEWDRVITAENIATMTREAKKSLSTHLTTSELAAFVQFMENPNGRSAMDKMKLYMADIIPLTQKLTVQARQGLTKEQGHGGAQ